MRLKFYILFLIVTALLLVACLGAWADKTNGTTSQSQSGFETIDNTGFSGGFFMAAVPTPTPMPTMGPYGFTGMDPDSGMMGDPKLANLVRDIFALRQINSANLSAAQIDKMLPVLNKLYEHYQVRVKLSQELLTKERNQLLHEQPQVPGKEFNPTNKPAAPFSRTGLREIRAAYNKELDVANEALGKILRPEQMTIIWSMISTETPDHSFSTRIPGGTGAVPKQTTPPQFVVPPGFPTPQVNPNTSTQQPQPGFGTMPSHSTARWMPRPRPIVSLDKLIDLLQEKLEALREKK
jgi:hypothetical protein